jgi:signal transduction histidine kinase
MKAYVKLESDDTSRLSDFAELAEPKLEGVIERFYERVRASPKAMSVLKSDAQIDRLRTTLRVWVRELLRGPFDEAYFERRARIGLRHVQVGLPEHFMFTAMNVVRAALVDVAREAYPPDQAFDVAASIDKITSLDLAIMTGTFVKGRENLQLAQLQDVLVSHLPVAVLLVDAGGSVVAHTPETQRMFGGPSVRRHYTETLPEALVDGASLQTRVNQALTSGEPVVLERVDVRLGGRSTSFRLSIVPLEHPLARFLLHIEDLSDAVQAESRIQQAEALAQLGALSAAVAHELRNPLAGISGAMQVIVRTLPADDSRREVMEKVLAQIRRLDTMVRDLLAFASPRAASLETTDLRDVAEAAVELVRRTHPTATIRLHGRGLAVADGDLLHQMLLNLTQNALQEIGTEGEVRIMVTPGSVQICDSGGGVPEDLRGDIFKPFFTTKTRGTGLGLAICERAAKSMNGTLRLMESGPLRGAAFRLDLQVPNREAY